MIRYRKLGDSLMATPVLRALGERGEVFAVGEACYERVFTEMPGVAGFEGLERGEPSRLALVRAGLRARRFRCDTALVLRFNRRASIVARLAGCRTRIGGTRSRAPLLTGLTRNVYDAATWPHNHQVEKYYAVAEAAAGPLPRYPTHYAPLGTDVGGLPEGYAVVHLGNGGSNQDWPDASFAATVEALKARGLLVVTTGEDAATYPRARAAADLDFVRKTHLDGLAGLFAGAGVVIGLDGGGPRLASAVGTPVVVLAVGDRWNELQASPWMAPGMVVEAPVEPEAVVEAARSLLR